MNGEQKEGLEKLPHKGERKVKWNAATSGKGLARAGPLTSVEL